MAQIKIYGIKETLDPIKQRLSDCIHQCVMEALKFPKDKRAHRFIGMNKEDFFYPEGRTDQYIIIEIMMITGRTIETKKKFINLLFKQINETIGVSMTDIEICIIENPAVNWGFRGKTGDEVNIDYKIEI